MNHPFAAQAALPVALRAYAQHSEWPFSPVEARLLPAVFYFKACLELATVLDELMRIDEKPLYVLKARKARVEAESSRAARDLRRRPTSKKARSVSRSSSTRFFFRLTRGHPLSQRSRSVNVFVSSGTRARAERARQSDVVA